MSLESLYGPDPPEPDEILCPVCGENCETVYLDAGAVIGCDNCILSNYYAMESWEWAEIDKRGREADEGDRRYREMKDEGMI